MTVEVYVKSLLTVCDEMFEVLQKARLSNKDIERWEQIINSYKKQPSPTVIYSDIDKYI